MLTSIWSRENIRPSFPLARTSKELGQEGQDSAAAAQTEGDSEDVTIKHQWDPRLTPGPKRWFNGKFTDCLVLITDFYICSMVMWNMNIRESWVKVTGTFCTILQLFGKSNYVKTKLEVKNKPKVLGKVPYLTYLWNIHWEENKSTFFNWYEKFTPIFL